MSNYKRCPRCGERTLEQLSTYDHCANCFYFEDHWTSPESDVIAAQNVLCEIIDGNNDEDFKSNILEIENNKKSQKNERRLI